MPDKPVDSSAQPSASDLRNAIAEQTQGLEVGGPETEVPETYEETEPIQVEEPESAPDSTKIPPENTGTQEDATPAPETEAETPAAPAQPAAPVYKIKVDGKEEEVPPEKVIEYLQKGRHYEKRMAEVKEKERSLEAQRPQQPAPAFDPAKMNETFLESFARDPINTVIAAVTLGIQQTETQRATERKADREFEDTQASTNPLWSSIRDGYSRLRETGLDRQTAAVMAENDFLREQIVRTKDTALKEGERKANLKQKAQMPSGHARQGKPPSPMDMDPNKMTRDQLKAALRRQAE